MKRDAPEKMQGDASSESFYASISTPLKSMRSISLQDFNLYRLSMNQKSKKQKESLLTALGILRADPHLEEEYLRSCPTPPVRKALEVMKDDMSEDEDCVTGFSLR